MSSPVAMIVSPAANGLRNAEIAERLTTGPAVGSLHARRRAVECKLIKDAPS
jgi:hypothetical protein